MTAYVKGFIAGHYVRLDTVEIKQEHRDGIHLVGPQVFQVTLTAVRPSKKLQQALDHARLHTQPVPVWFLAPDGHTRIDLTAYITLVIPHQVWNKKRTQLIWHYDITMKPSAPFELSAVTQRSSSNGHPNDPGAAVRGVPTRPRAVPRTVR